MSNVIKKVFNTEKNEAEKLGQNAEQGAEQNVRQTGENAVEHAKEGKFPHFGFGHHGHHGAPAAGAASGAEAASGAAPASAGAAQGPNFDAARDVASNNVPQFGQASQGSTTTSQAAQAAAQAQNNKTAFTSAPSATVVPTSESTDYSRAGNLTSATSTNSGVNVAAGNVDQDVQHLAPVVHQHHYRHEIEELLREREHHIHQHHIQHHVQPVLESEYLTEQIHSRVVPATTIREVHANTDKDAALMRAVAGTPKDTFSQAVTDRSVVDKGETVREIVHHHIHNIVQPIIEKDIHEYHRIRTTIPTTHITHEAPIVHESTAHQPIRKEDFVKGGGILSSNTRSIEEMGVLNLGTHQRSVEGENYTGGAPLVL